MQDQSDAQLLHAFAGQGDEAAFREIVARHTDFVYSAALRQVESSAAAGDITQAVFTDLVRKAGALARGGDALPSSLAGWLHRAARFAALNHLRDARRRLTNERQAMEQLLTNSESAPEWEQIRPVLDEALDSLGDEDREALLLRYFQNRDFRAVGLALGISDDTAQKRVSRAVERLREFFSKRNVTIGASGLTALISVNAVQSAPSGLAAAISATALLSGAALTTSTAVALTKTIAMTTLQKAVAAAACTITAAVLAGTGIYEAKQAAQWRGQVQSLQQQQAPLAAQLAQLQGERDAATNRVAELLAADAKDTSNTTELLRLRGEVTMLRQNATSLSNQLAKTSNRYGLLPDQIPPVISSGIPDTARSYARLVKKMTQGQLSPAEEINLIKAWPYLEKRFAEPDTFAFFQSEYLAAMWGITNRDSVWNVRRILETARDEEHRHGLTWARKSEQELQHGAPSTQNMQKIRDGWNAISENVGQQIKELLPENQQEELAAFPGPVLDFDPRLKSGTGASASDPRFQNLDSQEVFQAFTAGTPNARFVPVTPLKDQ